MQEGMGMLVDGGEGVIFDKIWVKTIKARIRALDWVGVVFTYARVRALGCALACEGVQAHMRAGVRTCVHTRIHLLNT